ncbi:MAG: 50S ribosomal protein L14 [Candidatus Aenigmarchaeota archaeon]|nr:50S ribosomal protein L14 [Candidatus Aenigmarchaeota archaeon]MBU5688953.1 50S ribosomal protein L14 [Candidatus Aenigmarchaeota archaeon]
MKGVKAKITRGIPVNSLIECADNTGAKVLNVIAVIGYRGVKRRMPACGVGDMIVCSVRQGTVKWRKQVVKAVVIRQKKEYRRKNGIRISFEDNAAVLVNDRGEPVGTQIKGPVAREAVDRFSVIGKVASFIV